MVIKNIIDEDFTNYKTCAMFIGFPTCTFKCEKESGCAGICQNSELALTPNINVSAKSIVSRYLSNPLSTAVVIGGLEPFDSGMQLLCLVEEFRSCTSDPIIIYTGYYKEEISSMLEQLAAHSNIIVKFGRFVPNSSSHFDDILGVHLASSNQYAEKIS